MSQPSRPPLNIVSASSRPLLGGWPMWRWLVLAAAAVATLVCQGYVLPWLAFAASGEHPDPAVVAQVEHDSRNLMLMLVAPWALGILVVRPRLRVAITGLACTAPMVWFWWDVHRMSVGGG